MKHPDPRATTCDREIGATGPTTGAGHVNTSRQTSSRAGLHVGAPAHEALP